MNRFRHILYLLCLVMTLASCSSTKYVNDGEYLLDKVLIESDNKDYKPADLKAYLRQQPNFKLFGLVKWQLYVYGWSGRNEKRWINRQLRKAGEAPVIMDTVLVRQSASELERFFVNKGYVNAEVTSSIDTLKRKKAVVTYNVVANEPYRIRNYSMFLDDPKIDSLARLKAPKRSPLASIFRSAPEGYTSLIKDSTLFDRDELDKERQRITSLLRSRGYYAFNRDNLAYVADSSFSRNVVDLDMYLKPYRQVKPDGSVVEGPHKPYYIKSVKVVTDYGPIKADETGSAFTLTDTMKVGDIQILYGKNGHSIRPSVLHKNLYLSPGQLYNERNVEQTYSSFAALHALKNVSIRFVEEEEQDTMKLNCVILTAPTKSQGFGIDLDGTNSAGDLGFASSLSYQHRNLFRGSETFTAKIRGAYESLSSNNASGLANYWEVGAEAAVLFPRFVFPFLSEKSRRRLRASSELRVSYNYQTRPEYQRAILSGGWSYIWQERTNSQARHVFKLLDVDYVHLPKIDPEFKKLLPPSTLLYNYSDQFILGMGYTYSFNNSGAQNWLRNTHSLRASVELAGNLLDAIAHIADGPKDAEGRYKMFGIGFSQFIKGDFDFSRTLVLSNRNKLAFHVGFGIAYPYGNSKMLPFERRYFSGGANSVRGWSVRGLGPGSMPDSVSFALKAGDIRLDLNLEYRTKLFWKFELAAYIDAGNIWTIRPYEDQKGGNFDFARFYKEIAVSYGLGLRLDFNFFLLRFDTGMKAYDPQETGSRRWAITNPNLKGNFAWHFAVGYPF